MNVLGRKRRRDLLAQRGTSLAVATVVALGVMLFVATASAYRDLRDSYAATRQQLRLAGLHLDLGAPASGAELAAVAALPGVAAAEPRLVAEVPVSPGGRRATLRVLSLPEAGEPALDRVLRLEGAWPGPGEVLLEKHFARHHHLGAGDVLPRPGGAPLKVSGVGVSAEYLWVARDRNDFLPGPDDFGVGWMRPAAQAALGAEAPRAQLLVDPRPGVSPASVAAAVEARLGAGQVLAATPSAELVGVQLLQLDVDGYQGMAAFFPMFFLGVGAFILASVLARLVDAQREQIGTFLALGLAPGAVLRHFVGHALVLGAGGALAGLALGQVVAPAMTRAYAEELSIPFVETHLHLDLLLAGAVMALGVSVLSGAAPAWRAMRLQPAEAMRPPVPSLSPLARALRGLRLPLPAQLAVRDVVDRPLRSLGSALGVAAALVLVLSTGALMDSMRRTASALFEGAWRHDARVDLALPLPAEAALARARAVPGVREAEAALVLPAQLRAGGRVVEVLLQAVAPEAELLRAVDSDGRPAPPGPGGLALTRHAARALALAPGDEVEVAPLAGGPPRRLRLTGFADAAMGATATVRRADVEAAWGLAGLSTTVVVRAAGAPGAVRAGLAAAFPGAVKVEDTAATRQQYRQLLGLGWLMVGLMLGFAGVLAGAILYTTATLLVLERQRELATLRALGLRMGEVRAMVGLEHGLLTALGLLAGLPLAALAARAMLSAFSGELFALPLVVSPLTVAVAVGGVALVVWLAQVPALRRVDRASLAEAVRLRG